MKRGRPTQRGSPPPYTPGTGWRRAHGPTLYLVYRVLASLYFWGPIKFLYLAAALPLREVMLLEGLYQGATFVFEVPSGYLSDRLGRRPVMFIGMTIYVASTAACAVGGEATTLIALRFVQGIGGGAG